jgi:hypothetical protein
LHPLAVKHRASLLPMNPSSDLSWPRLPPGGERSRTSSVLAFSLRPGTNFTATNVTGPGRILGNAFSSGGRRIEATLNRLAGYNPFALQGAARRLADLLQDGYRRCHSECGEHDGPASVEFSADGSRVQYGAPLPQPEDLLYTVLEFGNRHCTRCYRPYWDLVNSEVRTGDMEALLTRINRSLTYASWWGFQSVACKLTSVPGTCRRPTYILAPSYSLRSRCRTQSSEPP